MGKKLIGAIRSANFVKNIRAHAKSPHTPWWIKQKDPFYFSKSKNQGESLGEDQGESLKERGLADYGREELGKEAKKEIAKSRKNGGNGKNGANGKALPKGKEEQADGLAGEIIQAGDRKKKIQAHLEEDKESLL
jgi:hypothetical protein